MYFDPQFIFLIKFFMTSTNLETLHPSRSLFLGSLIGPARRSREDLWSGFPGVQIYVRLSLLTSRSQPRSSPLTLAVWLTEPAHPWSLKMDQDRRKGHCR